MMVKSTKMMINRPNQSLNDQRRRIHHQKRSNPSMITWMNTLVRVIVRTARRLLMLHLLTLQRSQREPNRRMILMVPVAEGQTSHFSIQLVKVHPSLLEANTTYTGFCRSKPQRGPQVAWRLGW